MNIVLFAHPLFIGHASMPRYTQWLVDGMTARGHRVQVWMPEPRVHDLPVPTRFKKWMGYIDQYLLFPRWVRRRMAAQPADTLYVFSDHALGPWVPLVAGRPHVIHCHDLLAQQSALGQVPQNPVSATGRVYQRYIRNGYTQGRVFIAISRKTEQELRTFIGPAPESHVVYNGVNPRFHPAADIEGQRAALGRQLGIDLSRGFVLHVGVNTWYKNRPGVLEIYDRWRHGAPAEALPLLMVGPPPPPALAAQHAASPNAADVHFLTGISDEVLVALYGVATVFLFPSIAEGFGWPIAEAMAAGCPVITTDAAPMTEVAGEAGFYIPPMDAPMSGGASWASRSAEVLDQVVALSPEARRDAIAHGFEQVRRFDSEAALDRIEAIYRKTLAAQSTT